jgi:tetratricopeptide (TPR) repeat protein
MSLKRQLLIVSTIVLASSWVQSQELDSSPDPSKLSTKPPTVETKGRQKPDIASDRDLQPRSNVTSSVENFAGPVQPWILTPPSSAQAQAPTADKIDLSALRYFASQNDMARVAAEIRLLRAKYPGWEPPQDLFTGPVDTEAEKPLWELFAKGDFERVRGAIAETQAKNPEWRPSADLTTKLTLAEANKSLVEASNEQQWDAVIDVATSNKMLLTCAYVDALWRTAEALVHNDDEARAVEAYHYVLSSCSDPHERLATIQKAAQLIKSPEDLDSLIRLGRRLPNGKSEFESVRLDLVRQRVGDVASDKAGAEADEKDIAALTARAKTAGNRGDQQLLGWYFYSRKDYQQSERWFSMALQGGPDAKAAEGLVLTLRDTSKMADAKRVALQYASLGPLNRKLMIEVFSALLNDASIPAPTAEELTAFTQAVDVAKSADGAQNIGWRLYNASDLAGAQMWFQKSMDWGQNESAALGELITARRLNQKKEYADLVAKFKELYPKVAEFDNAMHRYAQIAPPSSHTSSPHPRAVTARVTGGDWDANADAIVKELQSQNYKQTLAMLDERRGQGRPEPAGLSVVRGWAQYHSGDWEAAKKSFGDAEAHGEVKAGEEGLSFVQRGYLPPWLR